MAKIAKTAKKTTAPRKRPPTARQLHRRMSALLVRDAAAVGSGGAALTAAVAAATKPVTFTCSNIGCMVRISSDPADFAFSGTGGANFPVGATPMAIKVLGPPNAQFTIATAGGTLSSPMTGPLTADGKGGGPRTLTVP